MGNIVVIDDVTASVNSLTLAGASVYTTTVTLTAGHPLTVVGAISLPMGTVINGTGTLIANGAIAGAGSIVASNGLLSLSGAGSINGPALSIGTAVASTLSLNSASVTTPAITINNPNQTLQIGAPANVTVTAAESVAGGKLQLSGGTLTDTQGIRLGGLLTGGTITGFGTLAANVSTAAFSIGNLVQASGGTLDLRGNISASSAGLALKIDSSAPADLKIDGAASVNSAVAISSANQTLEVGASGALTINAAESITAGTIKLDGGQFTDLSGLTIGAELL